MSTIIVKIEHLREAKKRHGGYCTSGVSRWFDMHGMSMREFVTKGYPIEVVEATGDLFGIRVAAIAREMAEKGGV